MSTTSTTKTESHNKKTTSAAKKLLMIGIVTAVIILIVVVTLGIYINTGMRVKANINDNAKILNENVDSITNTSNKLTIKDTGGRKLADAIKDKKENFDSTKKALNELRIETLDTKNKLKSGFDSDTDEYYTGAKQAFDKRLALINKSIELNKDLECVVDKVVVLATNFTEVEKKLTSIDDNSSEKDSIEIIQQSVVLVDQAAVANSNIKLCFESSLKDLYVESIKNDIENDTKYYNQFSTILKSIAEGIKENNLTKINKANKEIQDITIEQPSPYLFENANFAGILTEDVGESLTVLKGEADAQVNSLNKIADRVSKKYII